MCAKSRTHRFNAMAKHYQMSSYTHLIHDGHVDRFFFPSLPIYRSPSCKKPICGLCLTCVEYAGRDISDYMIKRTLDVG